MKLKSDFMKRGLFLIAVLVVASVSAVAVGISGLANDNKAVVTFELVGVGPNPPPGWPNYTHTWGGNFTMDSPLKVYLWTLDGKPVNKTVSNPPELNWSEFLPPLEKRVPEYFNRTVYYPIINVTIRAANGSVIMTLINYNVSDPLDPPLPPGEHWYDVNVTLPRNGKDHYDICYFDLTATGTGEYIMHFRMTYINPHNKWNHLVGWVHRIGTDSTAELRTGDILDEHRTWYPTPFVVPREMGVGFQYIDYRFTVTKTGSVKFYLESHCIITDINGDGKVGIADVFLLSKAYGAHLDYGTKDANYPCDMDCDFWIDFEDIHLLQLDYGRTIPP